MNAFDPRPSPSLTVTQALAEQCRQVKDSTIN
jgi:hypothetical protein